MRAGSLGDAWQRPRHGHLGRSCTWSTKYFHCSLLEEKGLPGEQLSVCCKQMAVSRPHACVATCSLTSKELPVWCVGTAGEEAEEEATQQICLLAQPGERRG